MTGAVRLVLVWLALLLLLALTVGATFIPLGNMRAAVAYGIAATKAALVLWFFMELRGAGGLVRLAALAAFGWVAILFILVAADYETRAWTGAAAFWAADGPK